MKRCRRRAIAVVAIVGLAGCGRCGKRAGAEVARYDGGAVTAEDLHQEGLRLPPLLRARLQTEAGRRDLASAIVDKRLMLREARKRKLDQDSELRRQVAELEERLLLQALLAEEEKAAGPASEAELNAYYGAHRDEITTPERVKVRRIWVAVPAGASPVERERARTRADKFAARLKAGEPFEKVAADGDGPERAHGGELGILARGENKDAQLEAIAFALPAAGARSTVQPVAGGLAIVELMERRPARTPTLEEARGDVQNRIEAQRKRRVFDSLLERLRSEAHVSMTAGEGLR